MVASISTASLNNVYQVGTTQNNNGSDTSSSTTPTDVIEDSYIPSNKSVSFTTQCAWSKVNNIDDYKKLRDQYYSLDASASQNVNYESEFKEYMQSRGCNNEEELKALNTTDYPDVKMLKTMAETAVTQSISYLYHKGDIDFDTCCKYSSKQILASASVQDLADYNNNSGGSLANDMKFCSNFLSKFSQKDGLDSNLKSYLTNISNVIENSMDSIQKDSDAIEKANAEIEAQRNNQKYNASLISRYNS